MYIDEYKFLTRKELELQYMIEAGAPLWLPDPDNAPQMAAYLSEATVVGFGGAAGGGKSDLGIGKALNQHSDSFIARRVSKELQPIITRILALRGTKEGYAGGNKNMLEAPERNQTIAFASMPNLGDEQDFQGHPHDFKFFDEATNFLQWMIRFLMTWLRNTRVPGQVCEALLTFNPPQDAEGRWVIEYFAPWLDQKHNNPAAHGELRHFVTLGEGANQVDREVDPRHQYVIDRTEPVPATEFTEEDFVRFAAEARMPLAQWKRVSIITPQSRTFIGSKVTDNKYQNAEYIAMLQSLPEPLKSQMLNGDFYAGIEDSEWQVIPTAWIEAAMDRWQPRDRKPPMDSMGVDVARGGKDNTIIYRRHDNWYDEALAYPGKSTPDGPLVTGLVVAARRDDAPVHLDVVGVGSSPYDFLKEAQVQTIGVNGGATEGIEGLRTQGGMGYANWKSYCWWSLREDLDPANNLGVALAPDKQLLRDLAAPLWKARGGKIVVETREEIIKRIGRSPDWGSALVLARLDTPKIAQFVKGPTQQAGYTPHAALDVPEGSTGYDPHA